MSTPRWGHLLDGALFHWMVQQESLGGLDHPWCGWFLLIRGPTARHFGETPKKWQKGIKHLTHAITYGFPKHRGFSPTYGSSYKVPPSRLLRPLLAWMKWKMAQLLFFLGFGENMAIENEGDKKFKTLGLMSFEVHWVYSKWQHSPKLAVGKVLWIEAKGTETMSDSLEHHAHRHYKGLLVHEPRSTSSSSSSSSTASRV